MAAVRRLELASYLGLAGSIVGFGLAFGIMVQRAQAGTDYLWWTWWAIPIFWGPSAIASLMLPARPRISGAVLLYVAATGSLFFSDVYGYTAGALLANAGLLALVTGNARPDAVSPMEGDPEHG